MHNAAPNQRKAKKIKQLDNKKRPHSIQQLDNSWTVEYKNNPIDAQFIQKSDKTIQQNAQNIQQPPFFEISPIQQLEQLDNSAIQQTDSHNPIDATAQNAIQQTEGEFEPVLDVELSMPTVSFIKMVGDNKKQRRSVSNQKSRLYKDMKSETNPNKKIEIAAKIQRLDSKFNELLAVETKLKNEMKNKL